MYSSFVWANRLRVIVQHIVQRFRGRLVFVDNPPANFPGEGRVVQNGLVGQKNGPLLGSHLARHFSVQCPQIGRRGVAGFFVPGQFRQHFGIGQPARVGVHENLVNAVGRSHGHPR